MIADPNSTVLAATQTTPFGGRSVVQWCAFVVIVVVVTGTLLPFSFDVAPGGAGELFGMSRFAWYAASGGTPADVFTNFCVYVPVGLALSLLALQSAASDRSVTYRVAMTVGIGISISWGLEWMQTMMSMRVASWVDVTMNGFGTLVGALAAETRHVWAPARGRLTRAMAWRPITTATKLLTVGMIVYHLLPLDFVTSSTAMWDSLRQTRMWPVLTNVDAATQITWAGYAGQFALLGFLCVLSLRERQRSLRETANWAITHIGVLALTIEMLQLFTASHAFDTMDWLIAVTGGTLGVAAASAMVANRRVPSWRGILGMVMLGQVLYLLASSAAPFDSSLGEWNVSRLLTLPFWAHYLRPFGSAVGALLETAVTYAILAAVVRALLADKPTSLRMIGIVLTVFAVASLCEILQMLTATRFADVTDPLIALCVAIAVAMFEPTAPRVRALARIRTIQRS